MNNKDLLPYIILLNKMFKIEDELFQNKVSIFKRILLTLGISKVDMTKYLSDIDELHRKYLEIKKIHKDEDDKYISEFVASLERAIISLQEVTSGLYNRSKDINALNLDEYQKLTGKYRLRKEDALIALDECQSSSISRI